MPRSSAGLLPYRKATDGSLEVFIAHPGGPLWANRDEQAWSVVKGEYDPANEGAEDAAEREFIEETGLPVPSGTRFDLGEIRQKSGKRVRAWAVEAGYLVDGKMAGNTFAMEWPPRSGTMQAFPEIDRAAWMSIPNARSHLVSGQVALLDRLMAELEGR